MRAASASSARTIHELHPPEAEQRSEHRVPAVLAVVVHRRPGWGGVTLFNSCSGSAPVELLAEGQEATVAVDEGAGAQGHRPAARGEEPGGSASEFTRRVNDLGWKSQLKPGTYTFAGGTTLDDIIRQIRAGPV